MTDRTTSDINSSLVSRAFKKGVDALTICGDNGTSLLYSVTIASSYIMHETGNLDSNKILGIVSLIIWTLLPVFFLYMFGLIYLTDLENKVEGGSPAFLLLIGQLKKRGVTIATITTSVVMVMIALTIPDFWLTAAISFLAAFSGLRVAFPEFSQLYVIILGCITSWVFFSYLMPQGIGKINKFFGPITFVWFLLVIGFGFIGIQANPTSLQAFNPMFGFALLKSLPIEKVLALFGVLILIITGWEAAQLDRKDYLLNEGTVKAVIPIQLAFGFNTFATLFAILAQGSYVLSLIDGTKVLEGIVTNGSFITSTHKELPNLFFGSLPAWAVLPMVCYAVIEVIIAATATTLGAQNLFAELNSFGLWFRMPRTFTNLSNSHEFYVRPICESIKWGCIALMIWAQNEEKLAGAYGASVVCGMFVGSMLASYLSPYYIEYSSLPPKKKKLLKSIAGPFFFAFTLFFLPYLFGGLSKLLEGSWITLLGASIFFLFLTSYKWGEEKVNNAIYKEERVTLGELFSMYESNTSPKIGILLVKPGDQLDEASDLVPVFLQKYAQKHGVLPYQLVTVTIETDPSIAKKKEDRYKLQHFQVNGHDVYHLEVKLGWADQVNIYGALKYADVRLQEYMGVNLLDDGVIITGEVEIQSRSRTNPIDKLKFFIYNLIRTNLAQPFYYWAGIKNKSSVIRVVFPTRI
jgi:KUP system potassium uptake protein